MRGGAFVVGRKPLEHERKEKAPPRMRESANAEMGGAVQISATRLKPVVSSFVAPKAIYQRTAFTLPSHLSRDLFWLDSAQSTKRAGSRD